MVLDASTLTVPQLTTPVGIPAWPSTQERHAMLDGLNSALRRPADHGGLATVARLLDRLAASEPPRADGAVWLADTNARMSTAGLLREVFSDPDLHVVASQYAEDAHRRGWLRLDRTLTPEEHAALVGGVREWTRQGRALPELLERFGPPSVLHGPSAPDRPKTLTYATADPDAAVVAVHLGAAPAGGPVVVLAVRIDEDFLRGWEFTPYGEQVFAAE